MKLILGVEDIKLARPSSTTSLTNKGNLRDLRARDVTFGMLKERVQNGVRAIGRATYVGWFNKTQKIIRPPKKK